MPLDYEKLLRYEIPEVEQRLTKRDTILYALGVGLGADPCDEDQLKFVYEANLQALPTMAMVGAAVTDGAGGTGEATRYGLAAVRASVACATVRYPVARRPHARARHDPPRR